MRAPIVDTSDKTDTSSTRIEADISKIDASGSRNKNSTLRWFPLRSSHRMTIDSILKPSNSIVTSGIRQDPRECTTQELVNICDAKKEAQSASIDVGLSYSKSDEVFQDSRDDSYSSSESTDMISLLGEFEIQNWRHADI